MCKEVKLLSSTSTCKGPIMKRVSFLFASVLFSLFVLSGTASAQVAVPCATLQRVSDLSPGVHQVDGGTLEVSADQKSATVTPDAGGTACRFEALNADGSTPDGGTFDGNHYSQTAPINTLEFAFMPSSTTASTTNTPVAVGAVSLVGFVVLGLFFASKHVLTS